MHYIEKSIKPVVLYLLLMLIVQSQGYSLNSGNEKIIIVVDYFLYLDTYEEYHKNGSRFSSYEGDNQTCLCNITNDCVCDSFEGALMHAENNTLIFIKNAMESVSSNIRLYNIANLSIFGYQKVIEIICLSKTSIIFENCENVYNGEYHMG